MAANRYVCLVLLALAFSAGARPSGEPRHVAVISVDGLGASELFGKPSCLASGSTIRALAGRGAYSRGVTGVLPTITYPTHATIVTGAPPERHGVIDNGTGGVWFKSRSDIRIPTLWDAARGAGRTVAIVTWPSTYGADVDWLVPEDLTNDANATEAIRKGSTPGLFDSLVSATGKTALRAFMDPEAGVPLDAMTSRFANEVVRRHRPQLLLMHFLDYDHRMHAGPWSPDACKALERIDGYIARLVDAYRAAGILERTTFFVLSDHGFLPVRKMINVPALLRDAGWDAVFPGKDPSNAFDVRNAGGSIAFYPRGAPAGVAGTAVERLRPRLREKYGPTVRWVTQSQAHAFGGFPGAVFTLCARSGYSFTLSPDKRVLLEPGAIGGMHGFCPDERAMDGLLIASGYGVRAAGAVQRMSMADLGPTIASFVGAALPAATGRDRSDAFRDHPRRP